MTDEQTAQLFKLQADICKTLSDPTRLMILHELRDGEMAVGQLATNLEVPQSTVSRHLAVLRERGVVTTRREGTTIYYSLASPKIAEACDLVRGFLLKRMESSKELTSHIMF